MPNYRKSQTDCVEKLSIKIFQDFGIYAEQNNIENITAVDLRLGKNNIKVDVQYSQDFAKWGDLRLDFVSAYSLGIKNISYSNIPMFQKFESTYGYRVDKVGKYFQDNYLDAIIILFYNNKLYIDNNTDIAYMPDNILIISKEQLISYLHDNIDECLKKLKLNNKSSLGDIHGSAFLPINVSMLVSKTQCYYGTYDELKQYTQDIKKYLKCE